MGLCDKSADLPDDIKEILQGMADRYANKSDDAYCCWRLREIPPGVKDFSSNPIGIITQADGGVINDNGNIWGLFSQKRIYSRNLIKDFEVYLYNGSVKNSPLTSNHDKMYRQCATKCFKSQKAANFNVADKPFTGVQSQGNVTYRVKAPEIRLSNSRLNWYKQAQANKFNPEMLNNVKNLDNFTQEQWQAAKDWASKQPQWAQTEGGDANWGAKKGAIDILYNNDEFNKRKAQAPMGSATGEDSRAGVGVVRKLISSIIGSLSTLNDQVTKLANEGSVCLQDYQFYPSEDPSSYNSVPGIEKALTTAFAASAQAAGQTMNFNRRDFLGIEKAKLVNLICNAQKHVSKIQEQSPTMISHIDKVLNDASHPEHEAAKKMIKEISGRANTGSIAMPQGVRSL